MAAQVQTLRYFLTARTTTLACDNSALNSSTRHDFASITMSLPPNGDRTFRSVELHLYAFPTGNGLRSISKTRYGLAWGGGSATDTDDTDAVGGAAAVFKGGSHRFVFDVTAAFQSNFTGTTAALVVGCAFVLDTAGNVDGVCGEIVMTVEVDDANTTLAKTVCLPLDGPVARLATSLTELGTNQIPALDTLLTNYSGKTYRQIAVVIRGNTNNNADASGNLMSLALDAESADDRHSIIAGVLGNAYVDVWVRNDATTNATHALKLKQSLNVSGLGFQTLDVRLYVTFDYTAPTAGSGTSFVSREIPFVLCAGEVPPNATLHTIEVEFDVPEASPTLKQSGVALEWTAAGFGPGLDLKAGSQSAARQYAGVNAHDQEGSHCTSHRIDSGAQNGAGHTLVRGRNRLKLIVDSTNAVYRPCGVTGVLLLNYTCTTPAAGDLACSRSVRFLQHAFKLTDVLASGFELSTSGAHVPVLPDTYALTSDPGYQVGYMLQLSAGTSIPLAVALTVETTSSEHPTSGWFECTPMAIGTSPLWGGYNIGAFYVTHARALRWTGDPQTTRVDLEVARKHRPSVKATRRFWLVTMVDFHSQTPMVTGKVTGLSSPGGITLNIHRSDTMELVGTTTSGSDGTYLATVPDPTLTYVIEGVDGDGNRGRSNPVTPS